MGTGNYHKDGLDLSWLYTCTDSSKNSSWSVCIISSFQAAQIREEVLVIKLIVYTNLQFPYVWARFMAYILKLKIHRNVGLKINIGCEAII